MKSESASWHHFPPKFLPSWNINTFWIYYQKPVFLIPDPSLTDDRFTDAVAASGTNNVLAPIQMLARRVGWGVQKLVFDWWCVLFLEGGESSCNAQRSGFYEKFGFLCDLAGSMFSNAQFWIDYYRVRNHWSSQVRKFWVLNLLLWCDFISSKFSLLFEKTTLLSQMFSMFTIYRYFWII